MESNDETTIGERIKKLREEKGDTQATVAKNLHVKRETVNQWENGSRDLKTQYTINLADYFNTTCDYILRGVHSKNVDIHRETGLSDKAISQLKEWKKEEKPVFDIVDILFSNMQFHRILERISEHKSYTKKINELKCEINEIEDKNHEYSYEEMLEYDTGQVQYEGIANYQKLQKFKEWEIEQDFFDILKELFYKTKTHK